MEGKLGKNNAGRLADAKQARAAHQTRASPQAAALEEISGPTARVLSLALRAADRGS